jgi:hypothetical protein
MGRGKCGIASTARNISDNHLNITPQINPTSLLVAVIGNFPSQFIRNGAKINVSKTGMFVLRSLDRIRLCLENNRWFYDFLVFPMTCSTVRPSALSSPSSRMIVSPSASSSSYLPSSLVDMNLFLVDDEGWSIPLKRDSTFKIGSGSANIPANSKK